MRRPRWSRRVAISDLPGRDIPCHHAACSDDSACADDNTGKDYAAAADPRPFPDNREKKARVLQRIVQRDNARSDKDTILDGDATGDMAAGLYRDTVADGATADVAMRSNRAVLPNHRAFVQQGERAYAGARADRHVVLNFGQFLVVEPHAGIS